ncbi:MAG: sulfotransferase [Hormoscilla sp. GM7CHS1pb]|nr:sulfotransferase [Hormoscilla sp. GM7CHS1pb]
MKMHCEESTTAAVPIFILCCERSGSSLLRYIIDTHPEIASPAELNLGELCKCLYYAVEGTTGEVLNIADRTEKKSIIGDQVNRIISDLMDSYVIAKKKRMWCEKSPSNLQNVEFIKSVFPESKYICLHRHAMDVVHSCMEITRFGFMPDQLTYLCHNSGNIVGAMVENWIDKTRKLLQFEREIPERCFRIKYESYILNQTQALSPMFEFLGVTWDASLLDSVFSVKHDQGAEDHKVKFSQRIHKNSIGKGTSIKLKYIPKHLLKEMNKLLEELEYPPVGPDWDTASSLYTPRDSGAKEDNVTLNVEEILTRYLTPRIKELRDKLQGRKVIYKIIVTGVGGGLWTIDLTKPSNHLECGENGKADCTVTVSSKDAVDLVKGNFNPVELEIQGKLHIAGEAVLREIFCWFLVGRLQWYKSSPEWW